MTGAEAGNGGRRSALLLSAALAAAIAALYWPVTGYDLVNFDDRHYILQDPLVRGGLSWAGVGKTFLSPFQSLYVPLVRLSLMTDVSLFGAHPRGFHITSLLLFAAAAAGWLFLLWRTTGSLRPSALAAALFAFHPLRVESVAWVAERKDVLCLLFSVLAFHAYHAFVRRRQTRWYLLLLLFHAAALMSKPVAVVFPGLLLLFDLWPLGRWTREPAWPLVREKLPLLALSLPIAGVTAFLQSRALIDVPLLSRLDHAAAAPLFYLRDTLWPANLALRFFDSTWDPATGWGAAAASLIVIITCLAWRQRMVRPFIPAGWLWFLAALIPVCGFLPAGNQWLSDRFTLLPHLGLSAAAAFLVVGRGHGRAGSLLPAFFVVVLAGFILLTRAQLPVWRGTESLMERTIAFSPREAMPHLNLATFYFTRNEPARAASHLRRALLLNRDPAMEGPILFNLGLALEDAGGEKEALLLLGRAVEAEPGNPAYRIRLAYRELARGDASAALAQTEFALALSPASGMREDALLLRALALARLGRKTDAAAGLRGLTADPRVGPPARLALADLSFRDGRREEAEGLWRDTLAEVPGNAEAEFAKGRLLEAAGDKDGAEAAYRRARGLHLAMDLSREVMGDWAGSRAGGGAITPSARVGRED